MRFYADLHVHSKYSRATSSDCDLAHLCYWAQRKGIAVIGTGDFTHPAWMAELRESLVPAEPGLFRLRDDLARAVSERLPGACRGAPRFVLSVEISTIYKKGDRTRKIHHLLYAPDFEAADRIVRALSKIGNLSADGRPILGLDSRHLLEIVLESGEGSYLVPAHIWTPWFSVLGAKAGFDAVEECYGDLAPHIFAVETGLSSDPAMNWRISGLDRYRLVSSSDAHSPGKLGREATAFDTPLDYFAIRRALETGQGFGGTVEFFPEEGKYHLDGHRKCNVVLSPAEARARSLACPVCGHPVTVGVLHRVEELADREEGARPEGASAFRNLVPLPEVLAELHGVSASSKAVQRSYDAALSRLGPELFLLGEAPLDEIERAGTPLLSEAIARMREGRVIRDAGYDGEYGVIRVFEPGELQRRRGGGLLFPPEPAAPVPPRAGPRSPGSSPPPAGSRPRGRRAPSPAEPPPEPVGDAPRGAPPVAPSPGGPALLDALDPEQRAAAEVDEGALLLLAGPGTGKTRTLTHRIAHLVLDRGVPPEQCLAITFTRRAADEMRERLGALLGEAGGRVPAMTFHALGLSLLHRRPGSGHLRLSRRGRGLLLPLPARFPGRARGAPEAELPLRAPHRGGGAPGHRALADARRARARADRGGRGAHRRARGAHGARRGRARGPHDRADDRRLHVLLDGQRPGLGAARGRRSRLLGLRGALPDRGAGRAAPGGALPLGHAVPAALRAPRRGARGLRGARAGAGGHAAGAARRAAQGGRGAAPRGGGAARSGRGAARGGRGRGGRRRRGAAPRRGRRGRGAHAPPAARGALRRGPRSLPDRSLAVLRGRRVGPAGRPHLAAHAARGQGPRVPRGLPGGVRGRPAPAPLPRPGRTGRRRGAPALLCRHDAGARAAVPHPRPHARATRQGRGGRGLAVRARDRGAAAHAARSGPGGEAARGRRAAAEAVLEHRSGRAQTNNHRGAESTEERKKKTTLLSVPSVPLWFNSLSSLVVSTRSMLHVPPGTSRRTDQAGILKESTRGEAWASVDPAGNTACQNRTRLDH
ncbi:uncharacterized protein SOCEGT47_031950 [Sorangium cellulosum]|uniref:UvrD-like helicase ATP-binding domain-containing protein n=1 Tax=Sorangium cellulosum TaxID=56 RepID=A0A4P2Q0I1_SORCE|nr:uncharacterized protein SOCEGT47_031950 [Sorangium cellulosum]